MGYSFRLAADEYPKVKRKGDDLFVEHTLSLTEALCGYQFILTHLDDRHLLIKSNPGEVIKHDQFMAISDEGMPMYQRSIMKGKLYINFNVEFPDSLSSDQVKALEAVFPPRPAQQRTPTELDDSNKPVKNVGVLAATTVKCGLSDKKDNRSSLRDNTCILGANPCSRNHPDQLFSKSIAQVDG